MPVPAPADSEVLTPQAGRSPELRAQMARQASRLFVRTPPGPLRLFSGQLAGQMAWLVPLALAGLALLLWLTWAATYAVVYSLLGGIFHFYYYLAILAPPLAVLAAVGLKELWALHRQGGPGRWWLPAALLAGALWQLYVQASGLGWSWGQLFLAPGEWLVGLHWGLVGAALAAAAGLTLAQGGGRWTRGLTALGLAGLMLLPLAWGLSSVLRPGHGVLPSADA